MQTLVRNRSDSKEADKGEDRAVQGVSSPRNWNQVTHKMMNTLRSNSAELYDNQFEDEKPKRSINPFALRDEIKNIIGRKPKQINPCRNGYIVRVESREEGARLSGLPMVSGKKCSARRHRLFNQAKGIIYVYEYDMNDFKEFSDKLMKNYNISSVIKAPSIRTRNNQTTALMLTFAQKTLSNTIYIPGGKTDTAVYPYQNRTMLCKQCLNYGHTVKHCRGENLCRRCTGTDHSAEECEGRARCLHCKLEHMTGARECEHQQKKRNPLKLKKHFQQILGGKPKRLRSRGKETYIVEVERMHKKMKKIGKIGETEVQISEHTSINNSKGIVYGMQHDTTDFEQYKMGLLEDEKIQNVELAKLIKTQNVYAKTLLIKFQKKRIPEYLKIFGKDTKCRVYEYVEKPMRCMEYNHTVKRSTSAMEISETGHSVEECSKEEAYCFHFGEAHYVGDKKCKVQKQQEVLNHTEEDARFTRPRQIPLQKKILK